jgi:glycosyltransferase involved in cell wall biosynthesis
LYNEGRGKQLKRTSWIYEAAFRIKRVMDVEFWLFGTHPKPKGFLIDKYIQKPSLKEKNDFYNHINIWLAPTALEGLHMPPAEAMLTGCPVIATNTEMNGMWDYLSDMKTGLVCEDKQDSFIKAIEKLITMKDLQVELGNNAREKILKLGSRKENMTKFVDLMRRLKDEDT